jgi:Zn-dependent M28 family amino/carboxypeptidase
MSFSFGRVSLSYLCLILAASCARASSNKIWTEFSGDKALAHVQRLVDLGPRTPGSDAIVKARSYIKEQLKSFGWEVTEQAFTDETPRGKVQFVNLIARFRGDKLRSSIPAFLLCSHYDTKIFDTFRFVGANDGGSSTGLLLELARVLGQQPNPAARIELVFFDGEEAFENFSNTDGIYGSRHFAHEFEKAPAAKFFRGILFDMIGDRDLKVTIPPNSPPNLARDIFASADALKLRDHFTYFDQDITDDHTPLNAVGMSVIDLIDFRFSYWHTADDTIDKLSPQSLQVVGSVALYYLSELAFK